MAVGPQAAARRRAFTLIELLTVISLIAILAGLLLPAMATVRNLAKQMVCIGNQRQVMLASIAYAGEEEGRLPPADSLPFPSIIGRAPHLQLMAHGFLPTDWVVGTVPVAGKWMQANLRHPNPMACPLQIPESPNYFAFYGVRYFTDYGAANAAYQGEIPGGTGGSAVLARLNPHMPYLAENGNLVTLRSSYWVSTANASFVNGPFPRLMHRGRAVVAFGDGRVAAHGAATLTGDDQILAGCINPLGP